MADTWKTVLKGHTIDGNEQLNVFYHSTTAGAEDALLALDAFVTDWIAAAKSLMHPTSGFNSATFYRWDGTSWHPEQEGSYVQGGMNADAPLPAQDAAVIVADTGVRRVRPKKFVGGLTVGGIADGHLNTTSIGYLTTMLALWVTQYTFGEVFLTPGTWRKIAQVFAPIIAALIDNAVGTQRGRKPGTGA